MSLPVAVIDPFLQSQHKTAALLLIWSIVAVVVALLLWPGGRGRRLARQVFALAALGFREGLRLKVLWTVAALAVIPGILAYFSDADGTHTGRARLILNVCISSGELLGALLVVLLSALSVAREIESRIMHTLGVKPVPRWAILAGKMLGFWAIDLVFIAGLALFTGALVRAVPLRAETRPERDFVSSGTWDDLRRNALTTREYEGTDDSEQKIRTRLLKAGKSAEQKFPVDPASLSGDGVAVRFLISSTTSFETLLRDVRVQAGFQGDVPIYDKVITAPQDAPFEIYLPAEALSRAGELSVKVTAPPKLNGALVLHQPGGIQLGRTADSFLWNMIKAFVLLALQGWILSVIITGWSGVLSFPVTVALGVILLLGGEMSRHAIELMQTSGTRVEQAEQAGQGASDEAAKSAGATEILRTVLGFLPDFRAAGGPLAFVEGSVVSAWAVAHAVFWMGLVRALCWALPGVLAFQRREVGR
jgi:hypothetical protein